MTRFFASIGAVSLLALATPALAQVEAAPAQTVIATSTVAPSAPADFSGLWAISNNSVRGALDAELKPITGGLLTPEGEKRKAESRPALDPSALCLPSMPRHLGGPYPIQILQTPRYLVMLFEWDTIFRVIYLDGRPHPDPDVETRWLGHSVGRWEGSDLVVETTNFNGKTWLAGDGTPMSESAHLTERFRRTSPTNLEILTELKDPEILAQPQFSKLVYNLKDDWELKEYFCTEGNRDNVFNADPDNPGSLELEDEFPDQ
ncbi:hypothetical protein [Tsuneonella sp. HG222]